MNIKVYISGLKFMMCNTVKRLFNGDVQFIHSLDHGIYGVIDSTTNINKENLDKIKDYMNKMVNDNIPFHKKIVNKKEAYNFYKNKSNYEKAYNVLDIDNLVVSMFELEGQYNYFYSHDMPASTGELKYFDLYFVSDNKFVLVYPFNCKLDFTFRKHIYDSFNQYDEWLSKLDINYVSDLNNIVAQGKVKDLIKKNDIMVDNCLYEIAKDIISKNKKIILLAGPSSSGKTTSSRKLSLYLSAYGVNAIPISLDDFFVDRDKTPLGEDGKPDFECLESLDISYFNEVLTNLLEGRETKLPIYDFTVGKHTETDETYRLDEDDVLVIEGLHAINPRLITINPDLIYKVYISPFTPLGMDRHNYVSTTDNRLLRRIVRDFRTRGKDAEFTISTWDSVRKGEEKNIFPYTDTVDAVLNTAYSYEIGVLKVYIEPLLLSISIDSPCYEEAHRLLSEFRTFYPIPSESVPEDNLLREFIGGSIFERNK
jgi:uridine kinase